MAVNKWVVYEWQRRYRDERAKRTRYEQIVKRLAWWLKVQVERATEVAVASDSSRCVKIRAGAALDVLDIVIVELDRLRKLGRKRCSD